MSGIRNLGLLLVVVSGCSWPRMPGWSAFSAEPEDEPISSPAPTEAEATSDPASPTAPSAEATELRSASSPASRTEATESGSVSSPASRTEATESGSASSPASSTETGVPRPASPTASTTEATEPRRGGARLASAQPLPVRQPETHEPACRPTLDDQGHLTVAATTLPVRFDRDQHFRLPRLAVWPYRDDAVLVADKPRWRVNQGARPGGTLWLVDCGGAPPRPLYAERGADFGNAALTDHGQTLYFTGPAGVRALDLDAHTVTDVTRAPPIDDPECRKLYGDRMPARHTDVVRRLQRNGTLIIERGSPCGFEGDWVGRRQRIAAPSHARA